MQYHGPSTAERSPLIPRELENHSEPSEWKQLFSLRPVFQIPLEQQHKETVCQIRIIECFGNHVNRGASQLFITLGTREPLFFVSPISLTLIFIMIALVSFGQMKSGLRRLLGSRNRQA